MIFCFRKLNSKTLTTMTAIRHLHVASGIKFKIDTKQFCEVLTSEKSNIIGQLAILNYLQKGNLTNNSLVFDKLNWVSNYLVDKQQMGSADKIQNLKIIKNKKYEELDNFVDKNPYFSGDQLGELDIAVYIRIRSCFSTEKCKKLVKLVNWFNKVKPTLDAQISSIYKELGITEEVAKSSVKKEKNKPKDFEQAKDKKQDDKKEVPKKEQTFNPPKPKQEKKPKGETIDPEYQQLFDSQKIKRVNKGEVLLPKSNTQNILITSALPYVNNVPHLGNLIGAVLSADVYARYCRLAGKNAIYICGTDEYGTATEMKALKEGLTCQQICDKYNKLHNEIYQWFDIDFDHFGRTTTKQQTEIGQEIFLDLDKNGFLNEGTIEQCYCTHCDTALADRFVGGTCPFCQYPDAKGDQCDGCGKLLNPVELLHPKCAVCSNTPIIKESKHVFLDLTQIQPELEKWIEKSSHEGSWSQNSKSVTMSWIKTGLKKRCITRDLKWGTPVPKKGFENKVFYVWFDAPIGYISITANYTDEWKQWWQNPDNVKLYQFMGKDNIPFHTVIFPSSLKGSRRNWTMLNNISTTEYLNYEDGKFSKSRGVGIFGDNVRESNIPSEIWRYYLLANRPEKSDTIFTWADFAVKNNNELLPNIGNLCNRSLKFIYSKYDQKIPVFDTSKLLQEDHDLLKNLYTKFLEYVNTFDAVRIKEALQIAMEISSLCNKYLQDEAPWEKSKLESKRSDVVLGVVCNIIKLLSILFEPFMPSLSAKINFLLGQPERNSQDEKMIQTLVQGKSQNQLLSLVRQGQQINQPVALFKECNQYFYMYITQNQFSLQQKQLKDSEEQIETLRKKYANGQIVEGNA